jgi:hypothetical protein
MTTQQLSDLKGWMITETAAIVSRIEGVLERIETALARQAAENARLKRVEAAAVSALADLDAMLGDEDSDGANNGNPARQPG